MNLRNLLPFYKSYVRAMARLSALEMAFTGLINNRDQEKSGEAAFNGQQHRQRIFLDLVRAISFQKIYETGTFFGDTSGFMKMNAPCPVRTCDASPIFQSVAISRLKGIDEIEFTLGDSRNFLREKLSQDSSATLPAPLFFYLDAHWHEDLPLEEELALIWSRCSRSVVMIDDFAVPGDEGYSYDNYGSGKSLDLQTFGQCFQAHKVSLFYPSLHSSQETGGRRGCVVLSVCDEFTEQLRKLPSLREYLIPCL
jgi:hypothetical protein